MYPGIAFATITCRLLNSELTSDHCEDYGEEIIYDGSLPDYPDFFLYDKDIRFPAGKQRHVCDNVTALGLQGCRYSKVIKEMCIRDRVYGEHEVGGLHVIQVFKYGVAAHGQVENPQVSPWVSMMPIMKLSRC